MDAIQHDISTWAEKTFTHDQESITRHMLSEVTELCHTEGISREDALAIVNRTYDKRLVADNSREMFSEPLENADVAILSMTLAGYSGYSLQNAIAVKMDRNRRRSWGERNEFGFAEHVAEGVRYSKPDRGSTVHFTPDEAALLSVNYALATGHVVLVDKGKDPDLRQILLNGRALGRGEIDEAIRKWRAKW